MQALRIASLNVNGGRDAHKRALVSQLVQQKRIDVAFLQETHSDTVGGTVCSKPWDKF